MSSGLNKNKRDIFAEKTMDWGNLVFVGLVIGQLVPGTSPFRGALFVLGVLGMAGAYVFAYFLLKGGGQP
jgi:hypothetical protein